MEAQNNYFLRHWRGELPLGTAYWIDCFAVNALLRIGQNFFNHVFAAAPSYWVATYSCAYWLAVIPIAIWQLVGTWRSAVMRAEETNGRGYSLLGKGAVGLMLCYLGVMINNVAIPQVRDAISVFRDDAQFGPCTLTVMPWGTDIEIKGHISPSSAKKFLTVVNASPKLRVVRIQTLGGRIAEAQEMAELIRAKGFTTYVDAQCASAGVILLTAGKERVARQGAKIGFHSAFLPGISSAYADSSILSGPFTEALHQVGADEVFINKVMNTAADSIWVPDLKVLLDEHILTRTVSKNGEGFGLSTDELARNTVSELRRSILEDSGAMASGFKALARLEPEQFEAAVEAGYNALQHGADVATSNSGMTALYLDTIARRFTSGSDNAMHAWAVLNYKLIRDNMNIAPHETLMRVLMVPESRSWSGDVLDQKLPHYPKADAQNFLSLLLEEATVVSTEQSISESSNEGANIFKAVLKDRVDADLCAHIENYAKFDDFQARRGCDIFFRVYSMILELPIEKQGGIVRWLNSSTH